MIIEYSSVCMNEDNYIEKINEARAVVNAAGFDFGVQVHNSTGEAYLYKLAELAGEVEFSVHSPLLAEYFINLTNGDIESIRPSLESAASKLSLFRTDLLFFHGFFLTDKPIVHDIKNYRREMLKAMGQGYSLNGSFIMDPVFFKTEKFDRMKSVFRKNLAAAKNLFPELTVAVENDFVGIGSGLQRPEEIIDIVKDLWFDTGHFWCASLVHKFDFYEESSRVLDSVKVHGVHINHNLMKTGDPLEQIQDSHTHLYVKSEQNLKPLVRSIADRGIKRLTLEIVNGDIEDVKMLLGWLG
jgi:hypothetical protein